MAFVTTQTTGDWWTKTDPLQFTSNPWGLFGSDMILFIQQSWSLPFIVWPFGPWESSSLDELYPSIENIFDITVHCILFVIHLAFLGSIVFFLFNWVPFGFVVFYVGSFLYGNYLLCKWLLNGWDVTVQSNTDLSHYDTHNDEKWIFLNGVAVGRHWLQSNVNRISLSFGRPVLGVHNPTAGIVFDILQCLIQRDFTYVTRDIRNCYKEVKGALSEPQYKKVIFIIHSQGGIEGSLIVDWLLANVPADLVRKLEVYTFGNAANHFNNPLIAPKTKAIGHIEHYANTYDFVSRWGILHFASAWTGKGVNNRFDGRCFERHGKGHQFNQHYLDNMFPLDKKRGYGILEHNPFIDSEVHIAEGSDDSDSIQKASSFEHEPFQNVRVRNGSSGALLSGWSLLSPTTRLSTKKVSDLSRLWAYRNGGVPKDWEY